MFLRENQARSREAIVENLVDARRDSRAVKKVVALACRLAVLLLRQVAKPL